MTTLEAGRKLGIVTTICQPIKAEESSTKAGILHLAR